MAWLFVQLKFRLLANALRSSTQAEAGFVISTLFAVILAAGVFFALALLHGSGAAVDLTTVVFVLLAFGWLVLPLFAFGLDSTLDPATLALYPVRTRSLATGLLAASATGAWPLANVIGLLGVCVGLATGPLGELVAVVAVVLEVLFCITLARFVTTGMARVLRSRRGRDLGAFLIVPLVACYELFTQVVPRAAANGQLTAGSFSGLDAWLRWTPPGLAAHAIQDASHGQPGPAVARLALLAAVVVVLAWLWIRSLDRALVTADGSTQSGRVHGTRLPLARYGLRGAVAARIWIYQRRDPMALTYWAITAVVMAAVSISTILNSNGSPAVLLASAVFGAAFTGLFHANMVGFTGPAFVLEATALTSRRSLRAYLSGMNLVLAVIAVPLLIAVSFGLAALDHRLGYGFLGAAVDLAGIGAGLGLSNIFTMGTPYPMTRRAGNPTLTAAQGYAAAGIGANLGTLIGTAVLLIPVLCAVGFSSAVPAGVRMPLLLAGSAAYGLGLAWAGVWIAAATGEHKLPELCQAAIMSNP